LEYDLFGREGYYPRHNRIIDLPNDAQRINEIIELIEKGCLYQILISHDFVLNNNAGHMEDGDMIIFYEMSYH